VSDVDCGVFILEELQVGSSGEQIVIPYCSYGEMIEQGRTGERDAAQSWKKRERRMVTL
jgi:hypothetical protein